MSSDIEYVSVWLGRWWTITLSELESLLSRYEELKVKDSFGDVLIVSKSRYQSGSYVYKYVKRPSRFWLSTTDLRRLLKNLPLTDEVRD